MLRKTPFSPARLARSWAGTNRGHSQPLGFLSLLASIGPRTASCFHQRQLILLARIPFWPLFIAGSSYFLQIGVFFDDLGDNLHEFVLISIEERARGAGYDSRMTLSLDTLDEEAGSMVSSAPVILSPFDNLELSKLRQRTCAKWNYFPEDVLPLWVAEMDAYMAQPIVDAVQEAMLLGDTGYPSGPRLPRAIASFAKDRWNWEFDPEGQAISITDVMTGVLEATRLLSNPGDPIVLTPPIYPPFTSVTKLLERPVIPAPLSEAMRLDLGNLEQAFATAAKSGGTPILLLSNPHNPSGAVNTRDELESVARLARKYGARVVSDEIHAPLTMPTSTFVPYLSVAGSEADVSLLSASKGWNLAGFKAAIMVGGESSAAEVKSLDHRTGTHPGHIAIIAHSAAYNDARDWLDSAIAGIDANRYLLAELLRTHLPATRYSPPEATYLAWIDCSELGLGDDPAKVFLELGKVALNSGIPFAEGGAGHVRFNLATSPAIITEAVERMAAAVQAFQANPSAPTA